MKKIFIGVTALALLIASPVPAGDNAPWLKSDITYNFVLFDGRPVNVSFNPGWWLAWEGTIQGDVNGVIRWWVDMFEAGPPDYVGRWAVLDCEPIYPISCEDDADVIMAGYSAGTNFEPVGGVAEWSGKGVVTYVAEPYAKWFGRRTTEGGWYNLDSVTELPVYGEGTFMIFDRPSNKH